MRPSSKFTAAEAFASPEAEMATRHALLQRFLVHAAFDGWNTRALNQAARDLGGDTFFAYRCYPGGVKELAHAFIAECNTRMEAALAEMNLPTMRIRTRIRTCVQVRLEQQLEHREAIRRLLAYYTFHPTEGLHALYSATDAMWRAAGDTATDWNFYSKRTLLGGIYTSTLRVWLDDTSEGFSDTLAFLDRRIEDVMQIEKAKGKVKAFLSSRHVAL